LMTAKEYAVRGGNGLGRETSWVNQQVSKGWIGKIGTPKIVPIEK